MFRPSPLTILSSGIVALMGLFFLAGLGSLQMGTARAMGPGYLPVTLGGMLLVLSVALLLTEGRATAEDAPGERFAPRAFVAILTSVLIFGLLVDPFGLVPAVALATLVAAAADRSTTVLSAISTCIVVTMLCWIVFIIGLNLPVQAIRF
jgi:hypothetical protein